MSASTGQCVAIKIAVLLVIAAGIRPAFAAEPDYALPEKVTVMPVFLLPPGISRPIRQESSLVMRQLTWAQESYRKFLGGRDTFSISKKAPDVIRLPKGVDYYKSLPKGDAACEVVSLLLKYYKTNRFNCPWVFCCVMVNRQDNWPYGGGRPINGGYGRGGGVVMVSSYEVNRSVESDKSPMHFQTTLRHELGHAFGLPHVDVYGYDQRTTPSIMAYYRPFRAVAFREATESARFLPEDIRGLALNSRVFSALKIDQPKDIPRDYKLHPRVIPLGPMTLPGQPPFEPVYETESGAHRMSSVENLNTRDILPSIGPRVNFYDRYMWLSNPVSDGVVDLTVRFPVSVKLDELVFHIQHGGKWNSANSVEIEDVFESGSRRIASQVVPDADFSVKFPVTESKVWRMRFGVNRGEKLCVRGLQYFHKSNEVFPPRVPYSWRSELKVDTPVFPLP